MQEARCGLRRDRRSLQMGDKRAGSHGRKATYVPWHRAAAEAHPRDYYRWMLNGEALFEALRPSHGLFSGDPAELNGPLCFETFPHAVAWALEGAVVSAKHKIRPRRALLTRSGVDVGSLKNIDWVDAALCALTARYCLLRRYSSFGDPETGLIVVPRIDPALHAVARDRLPRTEPFNRSGETSETCLCCRAGYPNETVIPPHRATQKSHQNPRNT